MLILKFLRLFFGYVMFTASGGFPERFLNLCRRNKITLWDLKCDNSIITACTDCGAYRRIRSSARKSGMRVRIKKKCGLPFFLARHSRRAGVLIGAFVCVALISVLSTRIWSIDVTGNVRVPSEEITAAFEKLGVRKGAAGGRIDIGSVEIAALRELPELSWLNINIEGSAARIEVRERVVTPDIDADSTPADIVAARDGQIVLLRPFNGTQEQKVGNPVLKGDLLISGIEENKDLTVSFCRASGYVVARTSRSVAAAQNTKLSVQREIKRRTTYVVNFLFFSIPLGSAGDSAYSEKSDLFINGVTLPMGIIKRTEKVLEPCEITLNEEKARLLAVTRFFDKCTVDFRYMKVESESIKTEKSADSLTVSGSFVCLENIGEERVKQIDMQQENDTPDSSA